LNNARSIAFWLVLFLLILALFNLISGGQTNTQSSTVSYSDFVERVEGGDVSNATIDGERIVFRASDGRDYVTIQPEGAGRRICWSPTK
jgi:cell division protease FtsH